MSFNLGVNVVEVDGAAAPSIQPAPTSVAGFIIQAQRGVLGKVVRVTSWVSFVEQFGAHTASAAGAYAVAGFFANGGSTAYVTRVAPAGGEGSSAAAVASWPFSRTGGSDSVAALTLVAAYRGEPDPGAWGNDIAVQFLANRDGTLNLLVRYPGVNGREVESFEKLDFSSPLAVKEHINATSRYIAVSGDISGAPDATADSSGNPRFELLGRTSATAGADGAFASDEVVRNAVEALELFETEPIQLLACPETASQEFAIAALSHCEGLGDRFFVGHVQAVDESLDTSRLRGDKVYGALYGPNIFVLDPLGSRPKAIPPTGHVMGVYARLDRERGIWKAPAGDATRLRGVLDVTTKVSDADHTFFVKQLGVNLVRPIVGKGIVVDSARTLSTNTKWLYVNVRLLFNYVKSSLKTGLRWVVGEPNDPNLWGRVEFDVVRPFLLDLWRAGAFGPGSPEQVFSIKVDGENNTERDIEEGRLNIEVFFYPSRPAETIVVRVGQQPGASRAAES